MTREEYEKQLKYVVNGDQEPCKDESCSEKPNNCEDAISRQAVLDIVNNPLNVRLDEIIRKLPSITPKQRIGHWVKISLAGIYECSECGQNVMTGDIDAYRHCHGCGARMESED